MTKSAKQPTIKIYGNLGGNPELKTLPAKQITKQEYDPVVDGLTERVIDIPEKELRTFSLAVNFKNEAGVTDTRWIRITDWKGLSKMARKGDRIAAVGFFKEHRYEKDGEIKIARELVLQDLFFQTRKLRKPADQNEPFGSPELTGHEEVTDDDIPY